MNTLVLIGVAAGLVWALTKKTDSITYNDVIPETDIPADEPETDIPADEPADVPADEPADVTASKPAYVPTNTPTVPTDSTIEKQKNKLATYCIPFDFTAVIANYLTSEKYADVRYYLRFHNNSGIRPALITIKSIYITIMTFKQSGKIDVVAHPNHVLTGTTGWICVSELVNNVFDANTFGAYLYAKYGRDSIHRFLPVTAYITYTVEDMNNPAVKVEKKVSIKGEAFFDDYLSSGLYDDPLLSDINYPNDKKLAANIQDYRKKGRPIDNDYSA